MTWVVTVFTTLGLFALLLLVIAGVAHGLRVWWKRRRLARCRAADVRSRVAALRGRTAGERPSDPPRPPPTRPDQPHRYRDQHSRGAPT